MKIRTSYSRYGESNRLTCSFRLDAGEGTILEGPVSVRITAIRVHDIEAWPEHPDFWQGGNINRLELLNATQPFRIERVTASQWFGISEDGPDIHVRSVSGSLKIYTDDFDPDDVPAVAAAAAPEPVPEKPGRMEILEKIASGEMSVDEAVKEMGGV